MLGVKILDMNLLKHQILNIPLIIWLFQLLYVGISLLVLFLIVRNLNKKSTHTLFIVIYVIVMLIINIVWRTQIKKLMPGWY